MRTLCLWHKFGYFKHIICQNVVKDDIYVTHWPGWGSTQFTSMLRNCRALSPLGDKIFILRVGTVTTLHTVVLVWFTNILAEYIHRIMIAENIELKQYSNLNSHPFADRNLN